MITLSQLSYISNIMQPRTTLSDIKVFGTIRGKLAWCVHSTRVRVDDVKLLRRAVRVLKKRNVKVQYQKLELCSLSLAVYSDAGFASNWDLSSPLRFVVVMVDNGKRCSFLHWNSYKNSRVTPSLLGADVYSSCDALGVKISFQLALQPIIERMITAY